MYLLARRLINEVQSSSPCFYCGHLLLWFVCMCGARASVCVQIVKECVNLNLTRMEIVGIKTWPLHLSLSVIHLLPVCRSLPLSSFSLSLCPNVCVCMRVFRMLLNFNFCCFLKSDVFCRNLPCFVFLCALQQCFLYVSKANRESKNRE